MCVGGILHVSVQHVLQHVYVGKYGIVCGVVLVLMFADGATLFSMR